MPKHLVMNERGMTLVEIAVSAGLLGLLALGGMQLASVNSMSIGQVQSKTGQMGLVTDLREALRTSESCSGAGAISAGLPPAMIIADGTGTVDPAGTTAISVRLTAPDGSPVQVSANTELPSYHMHINSLDLVPTASPPVVLRTYTQSGVTIQTYAMQVRVKSAAGRNPAAAGAAPALDYPVRSAGTVLVELAPGNRMVNCYINPDSTAVAAAGCDAFTGGAGGSLGPSGTPCRIPSPSPTVLLCSGGDGSTYMSGYSAAGGPTCFPAPPSPSPVIVPFPFYISTGTPQPTGTTTTGGTVDTGTTNGGTVDTGTTTGGTVDTGTSGGTTTPTCTQQQVSKGAGGPATRKVFGFPGACLSGCQALYGGTATCNGACLQSPLKDTWSYCSDCVRPETVCQ